MRVGMMRIIFSLISKVDYYGQYGKEARDCSAGTAEQGVFKPVSHGGRCESVFERSSRTDCWRRYPKGRWPRIWATRSTQRQVTIRATLVTAHSRRRSGPSTERALFKFRATARASSTPCRGLSIERLVISLYAKGRTYRIRGRATGYLRY